MPIRFADAQPLACDFKTCRTALVMLKDVTDISLISAFTKNRPFKFRQWSAFLRADSEQPEVTRAYIDSERESSSMLSGKLQFSITAR
jgi:hypothetical protein